MSDLPREWHGGFLAPGTPSDHFYDDPCPNCGVESVKGDDCSSCGEYVPTDEDYMYEAADARYDMLKEEGWTRDN